MAKFWVGGSGNWSDSAHWATSSGGAGSTGVPTSSDAVTFDSNSGTAATVTANSGATAASVTVNKADLQVLQSADFTTPGFITLTTGTWDTGIATPGNTLTCFGYSSSNSNARTLRLNSSTVNITGAVGIPWVFATSTNLTFSRGTSRIQFTTQGVPQIQAGALIYWIFDIQKISSNTTLTGAARYERLLAAATPSSTTASLSLGANITVDSVNADGLTPGLVLAGNALGHRLLVNSNNSGSQRTITAASRQIDYCDFQDIKGAGVAAPFAGTLLGDGLGCSSISFEPSLTLYRCGTGGSWTDTGPTVGWSLVEGGDPDPLDPEGGPSPTNPAQQRHPLAQDTVRITAAATGTISVDMVRLARSLDMTGFDGTLTFTSGSWEVYGNVTLSSLATYTSPPTLNLSGRGSHVLDVNGVSIAGLKIDAPGGRYTLARAVVSSGTYNLQNGTFDAATFDTTFNDVISTPGNNVREVLFGTGVWALTGSGPVWNTTGNTALVLTPGSATIRISDTSSATKTLTFNGRNNLPSIDMPAGGGAVILGGGSASNSYKTVSIAGPKTIQLPVGGATTTIRALDVTATAGSEVAIESVDPGTQAVLAKTSGVVVAPHVSLRDIAATGGAQWYASQSSIDRGNNSGWIFGDPVRSLGAFFHFFGVREPSV